MCNKNSNFVGYFRVLLLLMADLLVICYSLCDIKILETGDAKTTFYVFDRQFKMLSAAEFSDFGCFLMLASGVILLQQTGFVRESSP